MRIIVCSGCSKEKTHTAKGYCHACYQRIFYAPAHRERMRKHSREYGPAYYSKNHDAILAKHRERYAADREHKLAMNRDWYRRNAAHKRTVAKKWEEANKDRMTFLHNRKSTKRRTLFNLTVNTLSFEQWNNIKAAYRNRCAYCAKQFERLTKDHVIPISKGGEHTPENIVPACKSCNSKKRDHAAPIPVQLVLT